jgi:serine/threonine-protein kinase RsbW
MTQQHSIPTVFRLTMQSHPKHIRRIEGFLARIDQATKLDEIQMHKLMVSLTEAVNNAIVHGNKSDLEKRVVVRCERLPGWLLFIIRDQGRGFHPEGVQNPLRKENLLKESGRGIFLMRTLMDRVEFERTEEGMEVRLWLDLSK